MAYVPNELKKKIAEALKSRLGKTMKERGFSYTLRVRNHSTIVMTIRKGYIDFIGNSVAMAKAEAERRNDDDMRRNIKSFTEDGRMNMEVNNGYIGSHFSGKVKEILRVAMECLNTDNYDNSDIMSDYFDVGHYVTLYVGDWEKPYVLIKA